MKKEWKIILTIAAVLITLCVTCMCVSSFVTFYRDTQKAKAPTCPPLPQNFTESDLVGTWIGKYFESTDKLVIRADGTYKQIYSSDPPRNFESDWQKWYIENDSNGSIRLHLEGMRRCDGLDSECNNPGGGLPSQTPVINPCTQTSMTYPSNEIIVFVTGSLSNVPRGIMFQQARLAGSDWFYTFRLEE